MLRRIIVNVDQTTWPQTPGPPKLPSNFRSGLYDLNIHALLLNIGYLTTPIHTSGVSLSEFWAWVRYLHAVADDSDLRLTPAFFDLDAHQKAVLSDDFGIGVPICWLMDHLQYASIVDGRYFINRMAKSLGAHSVAPSRRGPSKSPDFVVLDTAGNWHVIECKGTQSGSSVRKRQLGDPSDPTKGAVAQKRTITFPPSCTGQRLACGLVIAVPGSDRNSSLMIIDPSEKTSFVVDEDHLHLAVDTMGRGTAARSLRLAGFGATSLALAALSETKFDSYSTTDHLLDVPPVIPTSVTDRAFDEFRDSERRTSFSIADEAYRGRQAVLDLVTPIELEGRTIRSARLRYGISTEFLDELVPMWLLEQPSLGEYAKIWNSIEFESVPLTARMKVGSIFVTEIAFRTSAESPLD